MKTYKNNILLLFLTFYLYGISIASIDLVVSPERRQSILLIAKGLVEEVDPSFQNMIINQNRDPFNLLMEPELDSAKELQKKIIEPIKEQEPVIDDAAILKEIASKEKPSGSYYINDTRLLVFRKQILKEGDTIKTEYLGRPIYLILEKIDADFYTLRLNKETLKVKFISFQTNKPTE